MHDKSVFWLILRDLFPLYQAALRSFLKHLTEMANEGRRGRPRIQFHVTWPTKLRRYDVNPENTIPYASPNSQFYWSPPHQAPVDASGELLKEGDEFPGDGEASRWDTVVHPDGPIYSHSKRVLSPGSSLAFVTEDAVDTVDSRRAIDDAANQLISLADELKVNLSGKDIFLSRLPSLGQNVERWLYYAADHSRRSLIWLHKVDCTELVNALGGIRWERSGLKLRASAVKTHMRHSFESEYWRHVSYFPHGHRIPRKTVDELRSILDYNTISAMTAIPGESMYTFSPNEMEVYRKIVESVTKSGRYYDEKIYKDAGQNPESPDQEDEPTEHYTEPMEWEDRNNEEEEANRSYITSFVARLMALIVYERLSNFYGCRGCRLSRSQRCRPLQKMSPKEHFEKRIVDYLSILLFYAPRIIEQNIHNIWIDNTVLDRSWKTFVTKAAGEWDGLVIYATVLLTANVAFLVVPVVSGPPEEAGQDGRITTVPEVASQMSIITSIGSIATSLLLGRYLKPKEEAGYLASQFIRRRRPRILALLFSFPFALLVWSMLSFVVAVAFTCFRSHSMSQMAVTGTGWGLILILIISVAIISAKEKGKEKTGPDDEDLVSLEAVYDPGVAQRKFSFFLGDYESEDDDDSIG
ncbi:hypothetical protein SCHPADRAFT_940848 [Schizopora paradoxa]|uniref:Uncharacterized protein n=1 Tax=Schizopora paradoxa TaxID=27342 RepID=A0A0H2RLN3_9AGAM|nr:hypothetical protein SCHPADRAFT_940848 [Schizopora paradoxa]